jgi:AraC-like DNA-binding protein
MTITDAARQVGAGTRQYLGRLVRRHLGRPPSALRPA